MSCTAEFDRQNNPYRPPVAGAVAAGQAISDEDLDALRAYVGPNVHYYFRAWASRLENRRGEIGMNWVAFAAPTFWFAYRKMYAAAAIVYAIGVAHVVITDIVFLGILGTERAPFAIGRIAIGLVCGLGGNAWYLARARRAIATARDQGFMGDQLLPVVAERGGTSALAPWVMGFFFLSWLTIASLSASMIVALR
jgi:hypothetical protein